MKTNFLRTICFLSIAVISISCAKDEPINGKNDSQIPQGFNWKTTKSVALEVTADIATGQTNEVTIVKVYDSARCDEGSLIASGAATTSSPLSINIDISNSTNNLFVKKMYPDGRSTIETFVVTGNIARSIVCNKSTIHKTTALPTVNIPSVKIPSKFDFTVGKHSSKIELKSGKSYLIESEGNCKAQIDASAIQSTDTPATIFIKGKYTASELDVKNYNLVVIDGGDLTVDEISFDGNNGQIALYIDQDSKFTSDEVSISSEAQSAFVNHGFFKSRGELSINGNARFYNAGRILSETSEGDISLGDQAQLFNTAKIQTKEIELDDNAVLNNYEQGTIWSKGDLDADDSSSAAIYNYGGEIKIDRNLITEGTIQNYGYIGIGKAIEGENCKIFLANESLMQTGATKLENAKVEMEGGSIYTTYDMSDKDSFAKTTFVNTSDSYGLIIVYSGAAIMVDNRTSLNKFNGKIEVNYRDYEKDAEYLSSGLTQAEVLEKPSCSNGAYFSKEQQISIPESPYNNGEGLSKTPIDKTDTDGDGVIDSEDVEPNNPQVAFYSYFPSKESWGSVAFEDLWPWTGDYDMNDAVVDFHIVKATNTAGEVSYLKFEWSLKAIGSQKDLAMGIQLDKIPSSMVASAKRSSSKGEEVNLSKYPIGVNANGIEENQSNAVFALFNSPKDVYPNCPDMFNTFSNVAPVTQTYHNLTIWFSTKPGSELLMVGDVNPFLVVNQRGQTKRETEIHLCTYKATDLASANCKAANAYKAADGMMWAILTPQKFVVPVEGCNITSAYNYFKTWYISGNTSNKDWFMLEKGYVNEDKLYYVE